MWVPYISTYVHSKCHRWIWSVHPFFEILLSLPSPPRSHRPIRSPLLSPMHFGPPLSSPEPDRSRVVLSVCNWPQPVLRVQCACVASQALFFCSLQYSHTRTSSENYMNFYIHTYKSIYSTYFLQQTWNLDTYLATPHVPPFPLPDPQAPR